MFTGLIEEVGQVISISPIGPSQSRLKLSCKTVQADMKIGDSLAVDGICLTIVAFDQSSVELELSSETVKHSLFGTATQGAKVNLERALRLGDRLGGHIVQGHVDAIASLIQVIKEGNFYQLHFSLPKEIARYISNKGSITINGISLTIATLSNENFSIAIIPHSYQETNLSALMVGSKVHLESDILARYTESLLMPTASGPKSGSESKVSMEFLAEHGFGN
ncbi:MAG: riboflavin synthase [SAR324 cluster bacterium]|nr:riboflavin synthase [SAR324 cluster bacterium]